jgi:lipoprotein-releasing system permease protein
MRFSFNVAKRFLLSSKSQTIMIVLGIAIGVSVQIFIGLLIQGLQKSLVDRTVGSSSQITIKHSDDKEIENWESIFANLKKIDGIKYLSYTSQDVAFIDKDEKNTSVFLKGFDLKKADKIYKINENIYEGKSPENLDEIIVGKNLQEKFNLDLNEELNFITSKGDNKELKVVGFFDLKVSQLNEQWIISNIETVQNLFDFKETVTNIEIQVENVFDANIIAEDIDKKIKYNYIEVNNWIDDNEQLLSGLKGQDTSSYMIQVFVLVAVMLGISSVLAITVIQKSKQIGILKAMGIKNSTASLIFLFEGLILGIIGAVLGVGFGILLLIMFEKFAVNPDGTPVVEIFYNYSFILFSALIAVIVSLTASLIPAKKSSKLSPIEVIRNG